jgi:hypothetical protein
VLQARAIFQQQRGAAVSIQAYWRMYRWQQQYASKQQAALVLQTAARAHQHRQQHLDIVNAAILVQVSPCRWIDAELAIAGRLANELNRLPVLTL